MHKMKIKIWLLRILLIAALLWWLSTIFGFSAETGEESQSFSDRITIRVVHLIEEDYENLNPAQQKTLFEKTSFAVRKIGHFGEYAILGVLVSGLLMTFSWFWKKRNALLMISTAVCLLYAVTDEVHQGFVSGRSPKVFDGLVDTAGGFSGTLFLWILVTMVLMIKRKRKR